MTTFSVQFNVRVPDTVPLDDEPEEALENEIHAWFGSIDCSVTDLVVVAGDVNRIREGVIRRLQKAIDELRSWGGED